MLIARDKKTGKYINCFQTKADEKTLLKNIAQLSISKDSVEFVEVDKEAYYKAIEDYKRENPAEPKPKRTVTCPKCGTVIEID